MKVKTINYQKVFPLGAYINEKIGVEIEVDDDDKLDSAFRVAKELVHSWADQRAHLLTGSIQEPPTYTSPTDWKAQGADVFPNGTVIASESNIVSKTQPEEREVGLTEEALRSCDSLGLLQTYRLIIKKYPDLQPVYDEMHSKLSNLKK